MQKAQPYDRRGSRTLSRQSLHGAIAHDIGRKIVGGDIPPLALLPTEAELCAAHRVSRTAIREAIKLLLAKGLIEARPKIGTRVRHRNLWNLFDPDVLFWMLDAEPTTKHIVSIFELRRHIEPHAAALAAERAGPDDIARIEAAYRQMEAAQGDDWMEPDLLFHQAIFETTSNEFLSALASLMQTAIRLNSRLSTQKPHDQQHSLPLHRAVLHAIMRRNPAAARKAMLRLVNVSEEDVLTMATSCGIPPP